MEAQPGHSQFFNDIRDEIMDFYKKGWSIDRPIYAESPDGPCYWKYPFISTGTVINIDKDATMVESINKESTILVAGKDLKWEKKDVIFTDGSLKISKQQSVILVMYAKSGIAVSADHIFRLHDGSLITAERLSPQHYLTSFDGNPIPVRSVHVGEYASGFYHIEVQIVPEQPDWPLSFFITNGVVSGDYTLQLFFRDGILEKHLVDRFNELPVVGSGKYITMHGDSCLKAPKEKLDFINILEEMPLHPTENTFVPAIFSFREVPEDATSFISMEDERTLFNSSLTPLSNPNPDEWTRELCKQFEAIYNGHIHFDFEMKNPNVNARAWEGRDGKHVLIWGGLIRYGKLKYEGIALVMAHETGHHEGPKTGTLACEGEADYFGVNVVMRDVFSSQYPTIATEGIKQVARFFTVANSPTIPNTTPPSCKSHPHPKCRIATYHVALIPGPKPICAGK
jgi:hypothetical protein